MCEITQLWDTLTKGCNSPHARAELVGNEGIEVMYGIVPLGKYLYLFVIAGSRKRLEDGLLQIPHPVANKPA